MLFKIILNIISNIYLTHRWELSWVKVDLKKNNNHSPEL